MGRIIHKHTGRAERGSVSTMTALISLGLIGVVGLGVETGYWYHLQEEAQMAADVSAYAGAVALRNGETVDVAKAEAKKEAEELGFTIANLATVTPVSPPTSGAFQTPRDIEVTINYNAPRVFSMIFSSTDQFRNVRSVAGFSPSVDVCILALDRIGSAALDISGSSHVDVTGCEFMSNSLATDGFSLRGQADVSIDCANSAGGFEQDGSTSTITLATCPAPRTDLFQADDPFAALPEPSTSGPCRNLTNSERQAMRGNETVTFSAGPTGIRKFCNGLDLRKTVHFEPGIYIIDGQSLSTAANADVTGTDVTFYLTGGADLGFRGTSTVNLTAPTTGPYAGILFFGDRSDSSSEYIFNGTADSLLTGTLYAAAGDVTYAGDFTGQDGCLQIVAFRIDLTGGSNMTGDCDAYGITNAQLPGFVKLLE
ncbi:MAG: Tad domain-containing protein [Hyphomonadaceae bacterium]|nr:Tad domain-containing protein [Hyphomonadaceae bacterium]